MIRGDKAEFHCNLAALRFNSGQLAEALTAGRRALIIAPGGAEALFSLATTERRLAAEDRSLVFHRRHLLIRPDHGESAYQMALLLFRRGRWLDAALQSTRVLAIRPDCARSHYLLAQASRAISDATNLELCFRRALALAPDYADVLRSLGALREDRRQDASACYKAALVFDPTIGGALVRIGLWHWRHRRRNRAIALYRRAAAIDPDDANARCNLAASLLAEGYYREGWEQYEWRWQDPSFVHIERRFRQPAWSGEPLAGRRLFIHAEQGLGDILQFCRFAVGLAASGRVILEVYPPLSRLLSSLPGVDQVVAQGDPLPDFDLHCPLMSLPRLLHTTLETLPLPPYLSADAAAVTRWSRRVGDSPALRTGLVWSGGPHAGRRSMPFGEIAPLLAIPGIQWFSLQVGERSADLAGTPAIDDLAPGLGDFAETAAALMNLDLVITVDTAVAHLAGALGRPTWVLLSYDGDWRWLVDRDDSPWYPVSRLFRQPRDGDWAGVVAQVAAALTGQDLDREQSLS